MNCKKTECMFNNKRKGPRCLLQIADININKYLRNDLACSEHAMV